MNEKQIHVESIETIPPPDTNSAASTISTATSFKTNSFGKRENYGELDANAVCIEGTYLID